MTPDDPGLLDEATETTTHTEAVRWNAGDRVMWPYRRVGNGSGSTTLYAKGTVIAVDVRGLPSGASVEFDMPVRGARTVYAAHHELIGL